MEPANLFDAAQFDAAQFDATPWDVVVVGAGAAGLWAAAVAARRGLRVLVLEKTARCGTKILASGGTRCNLTTTLGPIEAGRLFGPKAERFLRPSLAALTPQAVREHFHSWGVETVEAPLEKIFPQSQRAKDVRDALEHEAREAGVVVRLECPVVALESRPDPLLRWRVHFQDEALGLPGTATAHQLFLASGGASVPKSGTSGDAYAWLEALGLTVTKPVPALVPLTSTASWVHELSGIAVEHCRVRIVSPSGRKLAERMRPVLFTHRGLSGPGAMDLSEWVARAAVGDGEAGTYQIVLDLLPDHSFEALRDLLVEAQGQTGRPSLGASLPTTLPRRLLQQVALQAGVPDEVTRRGGLANLSKGGRHSLVEALKGLVVPVEGTLGMEHAEVTSGGLALRHVNPRSMEVNGFPGLFVFGELLDLCGPIGGLNFQAAWATAQLAGMAAEPMAHGD
ncbi:MAG: aminoacetone oxidase family FAD-binding enzyme [Planctomycetes bacterium]|nr:aminoacetone oxidase family FAD-binding enzyme [Planctomycetota bacterium]MCB9910466.1 aminoacetone oxidase family FAD-binding enzyme [Planctomycetota bacterium]MCB9912592.1 aminoacetone oxidase family FAD-binding enzyme [Planctomycetota bacterium]HPF14372.1 aminoacetone oxidase family FAD-binding enzyme [Planctomycetota bacterium]